MLKKALRRAVKLSVVAALVISIFSLAAPNAAAFDGPKNNSTTLRKSNTAASDRQNESAPREDLERTFNISYALYSGAISRWPVESELAAATVRPTGPVTTPGTVGAPTPGMPPPPGPPA